MAVGRFRPRAARRRRPHTLLTAVAAAFVALVAGGCGLVKDAIETTDDTDTTEVAQETTVPPFDADVYCSMSHEADDLNAAFTDFDDPAALEGFFGELTDLLNEATPPPEIAAQFETLRRAYVDLDAELAAGNYDAAVLGSSPILSDANVNAAIAAVDQHDLALCGPSPSDQAEEAAGEDELAEEGTGDGGDGTAEGSTDPFEEALATGDFSALEAVLGTEAGRQAFIEGLTGASPNVTAEQAGCFLDNSEMFVLAEMSVDPSNLSEEAETSFLATLETCEIPLSAFG